MTGKAEPLSPSRGHGNPGNQGIRAMHVGPGLQAGEHVPCARCARLGADSASEQSLWTGSLRGLLEFIGLSTLLFSPMKRMLLPISRMWGREGRM